MIEGPKSVTINPDGTADGVDLATAVVIGNMAFPMGEDDSIGNPNPAAIGPFGEALLSAAVQELTPMQMKMKNVNTTFYCNF